MQLEVLPQTLSFSYTNWRGETALRRVEVITIWFGSTKWHPDKQWLMRAIDVDRGEARDFAMKDMRDVVGG